MFSRRFIFQLTKTCTENCNIKYINRPIRKFHQTNSTLPIFTFQSRKMSSTHSSEQPSHQPNRLANEKSPYLLQHATNPVNWYPWGPEAFEKARNENKLIFLSVGYSTCHWCHVMEKESFENVSVAEIMNRYFVNVKVDREERPDIDKVYMSFIHASSGSGGWPMSVFLTPNLEPITGGTYFPPEDKWGRPGFKTILRNIAEQWSSDQNGILASGQKILGVLKRVNGSLSSSRTVDFPLEGCFEKCINQFSKSYEENFGGFSRAPKFPQPSNLNFLFHFNSRNKDALVGKKSLEMALKTLKCMANGGINDHVSLGFARYSTDQKWHVPHFEKMLYDQGQLVYSFCDAFVTTKDPFFAKIVENILTYVSRDLSHETGGFYSAEDADSYPTNDSREKKEGAFCIWEFEEIQKYLGDQQIENETTFADIFSYHYNVLPNGNVPPQNDPHSELKNKNVLIIFGSLEKTVEHFSLSLDQVSDVLEKSRNILFEVRKTRPRPHLDTKILTAWNGLMISGFAKAGFVLNNNEFIERGTKGAKFIKDYLWNEDRKILYRCCYRGDDGQIAQNSVPIEGFLDDYAFLIRGLLDLYEANHNITWLDWAEVLQDEQDNRFWDDQDLAYFNSSEGDSSVLIRVKDDQDGAEPCGNSISVGNLLRLAGYLDRPDLKTKAEGIFAAYSERLQKVPIALPEMTSALMLYYDTPMQIFIVGPNSNPQTQELLNAVRSRFLPGRLLVYADGVDGTASHLHSRINILKSLKMIDNKATAYVCRHSSCSLPVTNVDQLVKLLDGDLPCSKDL